MRKIYIYNGIEYEEMPYWLWPNTSPVTESFFIGQGGRIEEREVPPAPEEPKHYSKLQILLYIKKDLNLLVPGTSPHNDRRFLNVLEDLGFFIYWDAADVISTDYENYEEIVEAVKEAMWASLRNDYAAIWQGEGYSEEAIAEMTTEKEAFFNRSWLQTLDDIRKYGEI